MFCTKANITGYAKIAFDALNSTVTTSTANAISAAKTQFSYNATNYVGSVKKIFKYKNFL